MQSSMHPRRKDSNRSVITCARLEEAENPSEGENTKLMDGCMVSVCYTSRTLMISLFGLPASSVRCVHPQRLSLPYSTQEEKPQHYLFSHRAAIGFRVHTRLWSRLSSRGQVDGVNDTVGWGTDVCFAPRCSRVYVSTGSISLGHAQPSFHGLGND